VALGPFFFVGFRAEFGFLRHSAARRRFHTWKPSLRASGESSSRHSLGFALLERDELLVSGEFFDSCTQQGGVRGGLTDSEGYNQDNFGRPGLPLH